MSGHPVLTPQDEDWIRFRALRSTVNHWQRPGWTPGRQAYYWYLTLDSAELRDLAGRCQDTLRLPYLDPVPLHELHLTLSRVGWSDEISTGEADAVATAAVSACLQLHPFRLDVGPLAGSAGAVRLSVSPWEPVTALYDRLRDVTRSVRGHVCEEGQFRPHVGIAYCNSPVSPQTLINAIAPLRTLPAVTVTVADVKLVLLRRRGRSYTWSTIHSLPLGEHPGRAGRTGRLPAMPV